MRLLLLKGALCGALIGQWHSAALCAQDPHAAASSLPFPDAPDATTAETTSTSSSAARKATASITGTVEDPNGAVVEDARVELEDSSGTVKRVVQSEADGQFLFRGLPSGTFKVTVTGKGWGTFVSPAIQLHDDDFRIVTGVILPVSTTVTNVTVVGDKNELSIEQEQIAIQQRVLGVFPNFYSSYDWNAPPMVGKQKFQLVFRSLVDPVTFLGVAAVAGAEQYNNSFPGYGGGVQGYAKRFGAAYANGATSDLLGKALLPTLFHQDPRYFYKGTGSKTSRLTYALSAAVMTRSDSGRWEPNYSYVLSSFASGAISNLYYPNGSRGASLVVENGLIDIAAHAGTNVVREFVLKRFSSRAKGAPDTQP